MLSWGRSSKLFRTELIRGFAFQRYVADLLLAHDIPVMLPRMRIRAGGAEHYKQEPDLVAAGRVLEVKSRSIPFMDVSDLPPSVLIDTTEGYDVKIQKPLAYIIVSQPTGAILWTYGDRPSGWTIVQVEDSKRGIKYPAYSCRRSRFVPITSLIGLLKQPSGSDLSAYEGIHAAELPPRVSEAG